MPPEDYFRKDRKEGITPPNMNKACSAADHIVRARGKKTNFTSVSLDVERLEDFGVQSYQLKRAELERDKHLLIEHAKLIASLQKVARESDKQERLKALQAMRYAGVRLEGLIDWRFDISRVDPKDVIAWAIPQVQKYFRKI